MSESAPEFVSWYQTLRHSEGKWAQAEPPCREGLQKLTHCWHRHVSRSMNAALTQHVYPTSICCQCGALRESRPNLDAHGPHHPDRPATRNYWSHEAGQLVRE